MADLDAGRLQIGSGYLLRQRLVLTAQHCTVDRKTGRPVRGLRVFRRSDGAEAFARIAVSPARLDVAVLEIDEGPGWPISFDLGPPGFGRVDRTRSGELHDCQAVGFPLWQFDSDENRRNAAELHGTIRVTEDVESRRLVLRDPLLSDVSVPTTAVIQDRAADSPWGGLSGALVFDQDGTALGVVVEHHPRQGGSAITILPVEEFAAALAADAAVAEALGLVSAEDLPVVGRPPLAGLVDVVSESGLPRVAALNPYGLGATPSIYGNAETYGEGDPYLPRVKDRMLAVALCPGRLVVVVGPSKAGKTRTAFEVLRDHPDWQDALLVAPTPGSLTQLAGHPTLAGGDPLVVWLDDLQRFLPAAGELSQLTISKLITRPGPTLLLATLRAEQRDLLRGQDRELSREVRMVLDEATTIELDSTREDSGETSRAAAMYPSAAAGRDGLAETLAGAPDLLRQYRDAKTADPAKHALVRTAVDWERCGLARIPESDLLFLAGEILNEEHTEREFSDVELADALHDARKGTAGRGQVALLQTRRLPDRSREYEAFDYLVAADDGQREDRARDVNDATWWRILERATTDDAASVGVAALQRDNMQVAMVATRRAAEGGDTNSQNVLGLLLASGVDPPEVTEARAWWTKAAEAGHTEAQHNLGVLLAKVVDPPELEQARAWLIKAAEAGHSGAQNNLGMLLAEMVDPPELEQARAWLIKAAEAGQTEAENNLGVLLAKLVDPPELEEARSWYTKAAEAGHTGAQFNLGVLLAEMVDPPELEQARASYAKAADAGHTDAQNNLGTLLVTMVDPPEVEQARAWYTKAAEAGHAQAQYNLGVLLAEIVDPPELEEARSWYTKAAEAGDTDAQYSLGVLLATLVDPPELAQARACLIKAAEAGHTEAGMALEQLDATGDA